MFDSHCHLHDARLQPQAAAAILRAKAVGVSGFLLAGVEPEGWRVELELAARYPECGVSYGIHPQLVPLVAPPALDAMLVELGRAVAGDGWPRPLALGEIGLDGRTPERRQALPQQERLFRAQLALARDKDLPVLLHILDAHGPALQILRADGLPRRGGVVHSYSGAAELVADYLALGLSISFTGVLTRAKARKAKEALLRVPAPRLLLETDSPDQTPEGRRPALNEPAFLVDVVEAAAALRRESVAAVATYTEENARRLLGLG